MPNNNLILRTLISPWITPTPDITKSSVLKHIDVDNNFIYLRGELIYSATTVGNLVTLKKINGNDLSFNVGSGGGPSIDIYNTYFVSPNGDDTTAVRGDLAKPYQTITAARNQVVADLSASTVTGDTLVYVYPGEYEEVELQYDNGNMYFERGAKVKPFFPPSGSSVDYYKLFIVGSSLDLQSNVYSANTFNTYGYLDVEIPRNEDLGYLWGGYLLDVNNSGKCYFEFNNVDIDAGQGFRANGNGELTLVGNEINVGLGDYCMQFTDYSITNVNVNRIIGGTSNFSYATSLNNFRGNCNINIRELLGRWRGIGLTNMYEGETNINISSGRFETLSGSSNEFIWATDFDGGIARINGSVTSNTGLIRMNRCDAGVLEVNVDYTTYGAGSVVNQIVGSNSTPNFTFKYNGDVRVSGNTGARFNLDDCTNYINGSISSLDGLISTPISNGLNSDLFIENLTIKDVDGDPIIGSGDINVLGGLYVENSLSAVTINGQYQILDKTSIDRLEIRDVQNGTSITNLGIDSSGNVVSGTTSSWSSNVNGIHYNSGNVGIGMSASSVNTKLEINYSGSVENGFRIKNIEDNSQFNLSTNLVGGKNLFRINSDNSGLTPLVVSDDNRVGIGSGLQTITPQATLHVYSTSNSQPIVLVEDESNPDATPFIIDIDGNVGISTGTPTEKLDVSGNTKISGKLSVGTNDNTYIGQFSGSTGRVMIDTDYDRYRW
jgi:hypothetical protein